MQKFATKWSQSLLVLLMQGWENGICFTLNTIIFQSVRSNAMKICELRGLVVHIKILRLKIGKWAFVFISLLCTRMGSFEVFLVRNSQGFLGVNGYIYRRTWLDLEELPWDKEVVPGSISYVCGLHSHWF